LLHYVASSNATAGPTQQACQPASQLVGTSQEMSVHQSTSPPDPDFGRGRTPPSHHHTKPFINFPVSCPCKDLSYSPTELYCIYLFTLTTNQQSLLLPSTLPNLDVTLLKPPASPSKAALDLPHLPTLPSTQYATPLPITSSHPAENSRKYLPEDTPDHVRSMQQRLYK
jgi:hypothetical protein